MEQSILDTVRYFSRFQYPPTIAEIHRYLAIPASEQDISKEISRLTTTGVVRIEQERVFLVERNYAGYFVRQQDSINLLQHARSYLTNLEYIPTIKLIGISGSLSMANGNSYDDIDLFIITQANTIWITRFMVLLYKKVLSWINPHIANKLCFNLFFSENGLQISKDKQNLYVGHEILQLKVIFNKSGMYHRLLAENKWVNELLPNAKMRFETELVEKPESPKVIKSIDSFLGLFQKWWLKKTHYSYVEKVGQLWLIQKDWSVE